MAPWRAFRFRTQLTTKATIPTSTRTTVTMITRVLEPRSDNITAQALAPSASVVRPSGQVLHGI